MVLRPEQPGASIEGTIAKLRILSPFKMRRIGQFTQERARVHNVLQRDNTRHFLGADRFYRVMDYQRAEGRIVHEVLDGVRNPLLGNLWAEVLLEIGTHVSIGRRTQIFAELLDITDQLRRNTPMKKRITRLLQQFEQADPGIRERATSEEFFRENLLNIEHIAIEDTLSRMFSRQDQ